MSQRKDPNQGEGDRASARRYDDHVRQFIDEGKVPDAATEARLFVDRDPEGAKAAEEAAKHGPAGRRVSVEHLVVKGRSLIRRVRPAVDRISRISASLRDATRSGNAGPFDRALGNLRKRFARHENH